MAKPGKKTSSTAPRPIAPPPLSQHLRELASRRDAWLVLARNLIPVVGIYGFGWSAALAVFNYWFDGLTALAALAMFMMAAHGLAFILVPLMALLLSYFEIWPERVLGAVFGDPARLYEYDPDDPASSRRRR